MSPTCATEETERAAHEGSLQQPSEKLLAARALQNWHREWIVYLKSDEGIPSYAPPESCLSLLPAEFAVGFFYDCNLAAHEEKARALEVFAESLETDETVSAEVSDYTPPNDGHVC